MATERSSTLTADGRDLQRSAAAAPAAAAGDASVVRDVAVQAALIWLSTRAVLAFFTYFAVILDNPALRTGTLSTGIPSPVRLIDAWAQWDVPGLLNVARNGYTTPLFTVWFPLHPLLTRAVATVLGQAGRPVGGGWELSGLLVSNLALLGAFVALAVLTYRETGSRTAAWLAPLVLSAYPYAFFLSAPYADPLFLALALAAVLAARQGRWALAGGAAFLAALTRTTAVILVLPLVWELGRQCGWWVTGSWRGLRDVRAVVGRLPAAAAAGLAVPAGIGAYMAYLWITKGSPTVFLAAEKETWTRQLSPPWWTLLAQVHRLVREAPWSYWQLLLGIDLVLFLLMGLLTLLFARRLPFSFTLFMGGLLLLCVLWPPVGPGWPDLLTSTARYLTVSFPVFIGLARVVSGRPALGAAVLGGGAMVQAAIAAFYLSGGWIG